MKTDEQEKICPKCHMINPPNAMFCDCGYDFSNGVISQKEYVKKKNILPIISVGILVVCIALLYVLKAFSGIQASGNAAYIMGKVFLWVAIAVCLFWNVNIFKKPKNRRN